jgi:hypothetical protein
MLFVAEKGFHPSIEATIRAIAADTSILDMPDAKALSDKLAELWAAMEQHQKEVIVTQQKYTDRRTKPCEFEVGNIVWLSGKNIRKKRPSKKLDHRFYKPYPVVERIGTQTYCLILLQIASGIHNVFHVSLLELCVSDRHTVTEPPPSIEVDSEEKSELEVILQSEYKYGTLCNCVTYKGY